MRPLGVTKLPSQAVGAVQSGWHSGQVWPIESKTSPDFRDGVRRRNAGRRILTGGIEGAPARMRVSPVLALHREHSSASSSLF